CAAVAGCVDPIDTRPGIALEGWRIPPPTPAAAPQPRAGPVGALSLERATPMASLTIIHDLERRQMDAIAAKRRVPEFAPGDTVKVMVKVIEGLEDAKDKKKGPAKKVEDKGPGFRLQAYEGVVIARSGSGINESFTVRKISY